MERFRIAGVGFELQADAALEAELARDWGRFASSGSADVCVLAPGALSGAQPRAISLPELTAQPDGSLDLRGEGLRGSVSADRRSAKLGAPIDRAGLEAVVRALLAERLARAGGLLVHGVALVCAGRAALFAGASGAGKSTLGYWAREGGLEVLSDEAVALIPEGAGFRAHGTPWHQGRPASAPLAVIGLLAHAPAHRVEPASGGEILRGLLPNIALTRQDASARREAFGKAARVARQARCVRLRFARDPGVATTLAGLLSQGA